MADVNQMKQQLFQSRRADAERGANAAQQQADDVIARRMAAIGQSGSGAAIGATLKAREGIQNQRQQAINAVNEQETQANIAAAEQAEARKFQSDEATKLRDFQSGEARVGREFAADQALKDQTFKKGMFDTEQGNKLKELDMAERQFQLDKETTDFNKRLSAYMSDRPELFLNDENKSIADMARLQIAEKEKQGQALTESLMRNLVLTGLRRF